MKGEINAGMTTSSPNELFDRFQAAFGTDAQTIPLVCVKLYRREESIPGPIVAMAENHETILACQAVRHAQCGEPILLTLDTMGCVAAAISLGLVDQHRRRHLGSPRIYTDVMQVQSGLGTHFEPPSPQDFTDGSVYACQDAGRLEFCLFGPHDSGRFISTAVARKAIAHMVAIQPAVMQGVFFYGHSFHLEGLMPDVVLLDVRPVELTRIIQGYQYLTGEMVQSVMNPVRAVDSDLIARPYLRQTINVSTYCIGARLMGRFDANRLGIGIPYPLLETVVNGLEQSRSGYPFARYPGAVT